MQIIEPHRSWDIIRYAVYLDGTPEQVLEKLFRLFDVNEDGTISRPEMLVSSFPVWIRSISAGSKPVQKYRKIFCFLGINYVK